MSPDPFAIVTVWHADETLESERRVENLQDLFATCKAAPPSRLVRVTLYGPGGDITLNFANFLRHP